MKYADTVADLLKHFRHVRAILTKEGVDMTAEFNFKPLNPKSRKVAKKRRTASATEKS